MLAAGLFTAFGSTVTVTTISQHTRRKNTAWHHLQIRCLVLELLRQELPPYVTAGGDWTAAVLSCQVGTSSVWFTCRRVCRTRNPAAANGGFPIPALRHDTRSDRLLDDRTDDCAFGAMMSLRPRPNFRNYVLR